MKGLQEKLTFLRLDNLAFGDRATSDSLLEDVFRVQRHPIIIKVHDHIPHSLYSVVVLQQAVQIASISNVLEPHWLIGSTFWGLYDRIGIRHLGKE
jgi:hypothetical protein